MARVASLHVYPVKSCRGIDVDGFRVTETGPEWDRRWMIVTAAAGRFMTRRSHPALARVAVAGGGGQLRPAGGGIEPLVIPLADCAASRPVVVCEAAGA